VLLAKETPMKPTVASVDQLIRHYGLKPHPEGGYFKESYRSPELFRKSALPSRFSGDRSFSTAIYYLLPEGSSSRLHRISADEVWHFYLGGPLALIEIHSDGKVQKTILGQDVNQGQRVQLVVQAGIWFGAYPEMGSSYSLVGCTVAPGFDFSDFEMGDRSRLLTQFPHAQAEIELLTNP
jgi:predicted cupin superfamily sugar epimerase